MFLASLIRTVLAEKSLSERYKMIGWW